MTIRNSARFIDYKISTTHDADGMSLIAITPLTNGNGETHEYDICFTQEQAEELIASLRFFMDRMKWEPSVAVRVKSSVLDRADFDLKEYVTKKYTEFLNGNWYKDATPEQKNLMECRLLELCGKIHTKLVNLIVMNTEHRTLADVLANMTRSDLLKIKHVGKKMMVCFDEFLEENGLDKFPCKYNENTLGGFDLCLDGKDVWPTELKGPFSVLAKRKIDGETIQQALEESKKLK